MIKRIVIDVDIPYVRGVFEPFFDEVLYLKGRDISSQHVAQAQAMLIRTRTAIEGSLLSGSAVRAIATATIGTDHIDRSWCAANGVELFSAAGCNARAVAQWVFAALREIGRTAGVIGIVGVGNVGREVEAMALSRGFNVLKNDPPRQKIEGDKEFVSLDYLLSNSDIVTMHVPLDHTTLDLVDARFLRRMKQGALFLNSSRGEIVVQEDLLSSGVSYALDVWRTEPHINLSLMRGALISTPHIAGYSARGKARASQMSVRALGQYFGIDELCRWSVGEIFDLEEPEKYNIMIDHNALQTSPERFEDLRRIRQ